MYFAIDAYEDLRTQKINIYDKVEAKWNSTYLEEFRNIKLEYIMNYAIYDQVKDDPELKKKVAKDIPRAKGKIGTVSESHLVNYFDELGDIPEYEPLSYEIKYINPMIKNFTYSKELGLLSSNSTDEIDLLKEEFEPIDIYL